MMRNARVDANQPEIVKAFRDLGWSVLIISQLKNCCDLVAAKNGITIMVEVKDGNKPPSAQKLTDGESKFFSTWKGDFKIVKSVQDVLEINNESTGAMRKLRFS